MGLVTEEVTPEKVFVPCIELCEGRLQPAHIKILNFNLGFTRLVLEIESATLDSFGKAASVLK